MDGVAHVHVLALSQETCRDNEFAFDLDDRGIGSQIASAWSSKFVPVLCDVSREKDRRLYAMFQDIETAKSFIHVRTDPPLC